MTGQSGTLVSSTVLPEGTIDVYWTPAPVAPIPGQAPVVSGTPAVGQALTCDSGTWSGDVPITFAYQWLVDGAPILGANSPTFVVTAASRGHSLQCLVTAQNAAPLPTSVRSAAVAVPAPPPPPTPPPAPVAKFSRILYANGGAPTASKYAAVVGQNSWPGQVAGLKVANPSLLVFAYYDGVFANPSSWEGVAADPTWLARTASGAPIGYQGDLTRPLAQVDNPAYQKAWAAGAIANARAQGFDGVFIDDLSAQLGWLTKGVACPQYPTVASWQAAVVAFLAAVTPLLRGAGLLVWGNVGGAAISSPTTTPHPFWVACGQHLDWMLEESWVDAAQGAAQQAPYFSSKLANVLWAEANGKNVLVRCANSTRPVNVLALASMLLAAGGHLNYATSNTSYGGQENWFADYDTALALGAPLGPYSRAGLLYTRLFTHGLVTVDMSTLTGTISLTS